MWYSQLWNGFASWVWSYDEAFECSTIFGRNKTDDCGSSLQVATSLLVTCCCTIDKVKPLKLALCNLSDLQQQPNREYVIETNKPISISPAQQSHRGQTLLQLVFIRVWLCRVLFPGDALTTMKNMQHLVRSSSFTADSGKKIFCTLSTNDPFLNANEITHMIYKLSRCSQLIWGLKLVITMFTYCLI